MSEWISKPLGKTVTFQKGRKVETSAEELPGYLRYLGAGSLVGKNDGYASTVNAVRATAKDVLMLWDGERSGLVGFNLEGVVSSTVSKLATLGEVTAPYLYYFLSRNFEWIQNRRTGTGVPHVPKDLGRIMSVDFPKCGDTQNKITGILQTVDDAIEQTEALIDKYSLVKAGMMHDLFTRGLTGDGKLRRPREEAPDLYKETPLGWVPKEWDFTTCGDVCEKVIDCKNRTPPVTADGHPVIRTPNVRNGEFVDHDLAMTDPASYQIWTARGKPKPGDIVITREAPVGEVCKIPERHDEACLGQRMMLYRTDASKVENEYFLYALQCTAIQNRLDLISGGSTVGHVRVGDIRELWMIVPKSKDEQKLIAKGLNRVTGRLRSEMKKRDKLKKQKSGLMHDLLTGEIQVEIKDPEAAHV